MYAAQYNTIEEAKSACISDETCGYLYDWRCDNSSNTNKILLCGEFSVSELISTHHKHPDCVYELIR